MKLDAALAMLREKNDPPPSPFRLPTVAEVDAAEERFGRPFPPDFRRYLLEASDVCVRTLEPVTITEPQSFTDFFAVLVSARAMEVPEDLLPICEQNADFYCLNARGEVVFWSHDGYTDESWPSLADWIIQEWIEGG